MYRITDRRHTDAIIAAQERGIPVRLITEPVQYRDPTRLVALVERRPPLHGRHPDQAPRARRAEPPEIGDPLRPADDDLRLVELDEPFGRVAGRAQPLHARCGHVTSGSSISSSGSGTTPAAWSRTSRSSRCRRTARRSPLPAAGATGVATTVALQVGRRLLCAHVYDIYFGTSPDSPAAFREPGPRDRAIRQDRRQYPASRVRCSREPRTTGASSERPWRQDEDEPDLWSFTTAGGTPPPPPPPPPGAGDVVLYAAEATVKAGRWSVAADATAAGGARLVNPNAGAPKLTDRPRQPGELLRADLQRRSRQPVIGSGSEAKRPTTPGATTRSSSSSQARLPPRVRPRGASGRRRPPKYNLEDCSGCGLSGWGWQDNGWGIGVMGPLVYFSATGTQRIRIQTREDGLRSIRSCCHQRRS